VKGGLGEDKKRKCREFSSVDLGVMQLQEILEEVNPCTKGGRVGGGKTCRPGHEKRLDTVPRKKGKKGEKREDAGAFIR